MPARLGVALLLASVVAACAAPTNFGVYYPHTRWLDRKHNVIVDAFADRLIISVHGKPPEVVRGRWRGRGFWRPSDGHAEFPYFAVAHEGVDACFFTDPRFDVAQYGFTRVRPDPKT